MGGVPSTPRGEVQSNPEEHALYLLGIFVAQKPIDLSSAFWQRLLSLPLSLHWPDTSIKQACESLAQNNIYTSHFAKLLIHLVWSLQEASFAAPGSHIAMAVNAARFSRIFLKYFIEQFSDELVDVLSLDLADKDAEIIGFVKGKQIVVELVLHRLLAFSGTSDTNPATYLLHLEVTNLLLVMMSTQLHSSVSSGPKHSHPFLDAAMMQDSEVVGPFVCKMLLSYITRLPVPAEAAYYMNVPNSNEQGVLRRVGSAAATVLLIPYYTYTYLLSTGSTADSRKSPLAENCILLLLVLVHYCKSRYPDENMDERADSNGVPHTPRSSLIHSNPFCQALEMARDTEFDIVDLEGNSQGNSLVRIPFAALYDTLGLCLVDECSVVLLYSLVHGNSAFLEYVLVRTDLDTLLMPILEMLYNAPRKNPNEIYLLLIILLILSQDSTFNASIHKLVLPNVPWYKDRLLTRISLGSLMVAILIRTVKYNLSKLRDVYLHTNCLATLANMAPHVHRLNAYAAQRLVSLFDMLAHKYNKLVEACSNANASGMKENQSEGQEILENVSTELQIYTDFVRMVLEIINAILTYALPRNPEVVYALLHRQELFKPFRDHPRFNELIENIYMVLDFFNTRLDAQHNAGEWSVEEVLLAIIANARSWRGEGTKMFTQLRFTYEEELHPEEFFIPYIWQLIVSHCAINWDLKFITLFPVQSTEHDAVDADAYNNKASDSLSPHMEI